MLTVVGAGGGSLPNNLSMNLHEPAFAVVNYGESRFVQVFFCITTCRRLFCMCFSPVINRPNNNLACTGCLLGGCIIYCCYLALTVHWRSVT